MKIAARILTALTMVVGFASGASSEAWAQTASSVATPSVGGVLSSAPPPGPVAEQKAVVAPKEAPATINIPVISANKPAKPHEEENKDDDDGDDGLGSLPEKVPGGVKSVVKRLNSATKDVTIDDLNAAREAVVKLDVLIDIEKRLNDLTTLRLEREEKSNDLSMAIPDSALGGRMGKKVGFPPAVAPMPAPVAQPVQPVIIPEKKIEVSRIVGASGRYVATIKDGDGTSRQIREGDKLADGSTVDYISRDGVTATSASKKKSTVQVKDINAVFGGR
jgi:hypothetical protein